jgi:transcription elongation factor Elf1
VRFIVNKGVVVCKFCRHYKVDTAKSQIQPVLVVKITGVKAHCTICGQDMEADFNLRKLKRKNGAKNGTRFGSATART